MVQLSLLGSEPLALEAHLEAAIVRWAAIGATRHAREAARITASRFASWSGRELTPRELERVSAYFTGVLRRRLMRGGEPDTVQVRQHLVAAAVEADLREAGWGRRRAQQEARRVAGLSTGLGGAA